MRILNSPVSVLSSVSFSLFALALLMILAPGKVNAMASGYTGQKYIQQSSWNDTIKLTDDNGAIMIAYNETKQQLERYTLGNPPYNFSQQIVTPGFDTVDIRAITRVKREPSPGTYEYIYYAADYLNNKIWKINPAGTVTGSFNVTAPTGVAVDPATQDIYVTTSSPSPRVIKITFAGAMSDYLVDTSGAMLTSPSAVVVSNNYLYVANATPLNSGYLVIYVCLSTCAGDSTGSFVQYGVDSGSIMSTVSRMKADSAGNIYVLSDMGESDSAVRTFAPDGSFIENQAQANAVDINTNGAAYQILSWPGVGVYGSNRPSISVYNGYRNSTIKLPSNMQATLVNDPGTNPMYVGTSGTQDTTLVYYGETLASVTVDFSSSRDWSSNGMTAGINRNEGKSFTHGLASSSGSPGSYSLYIPIPVGTMSNAVRICPDAMSLDDIVEGCSGEIIKTMSDPGVSKVDTAHGKSWLVSGLTGTGGESIMSGFEIQDAMPRLGTNVATNHVITFGTVKGLNDPSHSIELKFSAGFNLGAITLDDIDMDSNGAPYDLAATADVNVWGVAIDSLNNTITFSAPAAGSSWAYMAPATPIKISIGTAAYYPSTGVNQIVNPASAGPADVAITEIANGGTEDATINIPIVDNDQVDVTGFINTYINFDIDTAVANVECGYNTCLTHGNGSAGANYTVDLGELNSTWVNLSNSAPVMHSDGQSGIINSIYLDLTTNAISGATVTVSSANGGLQGPPPNFITAASDGDFITANTGEYGFSAFNMNVVNGSLNINPNCYSDTGGSCGLDQASKLVFDSNLLPIEAGRVRMDIAAAASYTDNPGNYTDTLTFIAVATF